LNRSSNQHTGVGSDLHLGFAHPSAAISFISSIVSFGPALRDRQPMKLVIGPFWVAALTTIWTSGNLSISTSPRTDTKMPQQVLL